ncbi:MAG: flavodoxin domain-containing protein, partial [Tissierellia bacterium]|nr:flavodoxin domain-containing protein [Tissierellia bacterium]
LCDLMREIPDTPIYCTKNGVKVIKGHHHKNWNFVEVKTGDTLNIGKNKLTFIEARMLHWPDTMFTYMSGENILFSNDGFGQHFASELMYNDKVNQADLYTEAMKYYANILNPFNKFVINKINEILSLNLPINMICPSHGIIWRDNPTQIVNKYIEWANSYQENQITIIYDTMWNCTRRMAEAIAAGITAVDKNVEVKLFNCAHRDKNDLITEVFKSKMLLVGSSTINKGILSASAGLLEMIKGLGFTGKKAAAFGSYGWSGESVKILNELLKDSGFEVMNEGIRELWNPDEEALERCIKFGEKLVK